MSFWMLFMGIAIIVLVTLILLMTVAIFDVFAMFFWRK